MINKKTYKILASVSLSFVIIGAGMNIAHIDGSRVIFTVGLLSGILIQSAYIKYLEKAISKK